MTDPSATIQFKVNLDAYLRADALKRMQTYREGIQAGVFTPNYARGKEDLPPLDGGDVLYMQAQMTPITMLGVQPPPVVPARSIPDVHFHHADASVTVEPAQVTVPVTIEPAVTNVSAPEVRNDFTVQSAPVNVPATVVNIEGPVVNVPEQRAMTKRVEHDDAGRIRAIIEEPTDG